MKPYPSWAYGFWLGGQGGRTRTEQLLANLSAQNIYPSVLWIQDWEGKRKTKFGSQLQWNWQADTLAYPQFSQFCTQLNQKGIKVLGYINPFLTTNTALCDTALSRHYVVHNAQNQPYAIATTTRKAYLIDLTNPAACTWYKIIKHNLIEAGLSGWMADYAEWLPTDAKLFSGEDATLYHNRYATDWAKLNRQAIDEAGETGKIVFFNRAGYSYANKYSTLFWFGDQLTDWGKNDGIHAALTGMLSGGISGIALNHSDIGGYTNLRLPFLKRQRSPELTLPMVRNEHIYAHIADPRRTNTPTQRPNLHQHCHHAVCQTLARHTHTPTTLFRATKRTSHPSRATPLCAPYICITPPIP